jgi:hypothetical protein
MNSNDKLKNVMPDKGELHKKLKKSLNTPKPTLYFDTAYQQIVILWGYEIRPIVSECLQDLLKGQPELSPQTMRWLNKWFGTDYK